MKHIRYWRKKRGFSQEELAERVGVHVNTVVRWEGGTRDPRAPDILNLCRVLEITEKELFNGPKSLRITFYWEVENMDVVRLEKNEFSMGYRNDGSLLFWGALPWDMDVDELLLRIKVEIMAAKEGKKARDAALKEKQNG